MSPRIIDERNDSCPYLGHVPFFAPKLASDPEHRGQPQPPAGEFGREEGVEDAPKRLRRHPAAGVGDAQLEAVATGILAARMKKLEPLRAGVGAVGAVPPIPAPGSPAHPMESTSTGVI